jgi:hypothetical protein
MALTRKNQHIAATPVKVTATHDQRYMCLLAVPIPQKQNSSGVAKLGRGYWLISLMGYWGIGVLGYWGIGVLGYWGIGVLGYWGIGNVSANISHRAAQKLR